MIKDNISDKNEETKKIIAQIIEASGLSKRQFSIKTKISSGNLWKYETGNRSIGFDKLIKLMKDLEIDFKNIEIKSNK